MQGDAKNRVVSKALFRKTRDKTDHSKIWGLVCPHVLEVSRAAILLGEPVCTLIKLTSFAAGALGRVGAVEIRDVVVSNIAEPRYSCE
jgi:hypothetical protein